MSPNDAIDLAFQCYGEELPQPDRAVRQQSLSLSRRHRRKGHRAIATIEALESLTLLANNPLVPAIDHSNTPTEGLLGHWSPGEMDGRAGYINVGDVEFLDGREAFTIGADFMVPDTQGQYPIVGKWLTSGMMRGFLVDVNEGTLRAIVGTGTATQTVTEVPIEPNVLYHVDVTKDVGFVHLYLNGVLASTSPNSAVQSGNREPLIIGGKTDNGEVTAVMKGKLSRVWIVDRALSADEICARSLPAQPSAPMGPESDRSEGNRGIDPPAEGLLGHWSPGELDGQAGFINVGDVDFLDGRESWTIGADFMVLDTAGQYPILGKWLTSGMMRGFLVDVNEGTLRAIVGTSASTQTVTEVPIEPNVLYHVDVTKDSGFAHVYLNGVLAASTANGTVQTGNREPLVIGGKSDNGVVTAVMKGALPSVWIVDHALSAEEIRTRYEQRSQDPLDEESTDTGNVFDEETPAEAPAPLYHSNELVQVGGYNAASLGNDSRFALQSFTIWGRLQRYRTGADENTFDVLLSLQQQIHSDHGLAGVIFGFRYDRVLLYVAVNDRFVTIESTRTFTDLTRPYELAATVDGATHEAVLYVDGEEVGRGTLPGAVDYSSGQTVTIVGDCFGYRFKDAPRNGRAMGGDRQIQAVAVWDTVLKAGQIREYSAANPANPDHNTVRIFNVGDGLTLLSSGLASDLNQDYGGRFEKWLAELNGHRYFVLPTGELFRRTNTTVDTASGELVAALDPSSLYDQLPGLKSTDLYGFRSLSAHNKEFANWDAVARYLEGLEPLRHFYLQFVVGDHFIDPHDAQDIAERRHPDLFADATDHSSLTMDRRTRTVAEISDQIRKHNRNVANAADKLVLRDLPPGSFSTSTWTANRDYEVMPGTSDAYFLNGVTFETIERALHRHAEFVAALNSHVAFVREQALGRPMRNDNSTEHSADEDVAASIARVVDALIASVEFDAAHDVAEPTDDENPSTVEERAAQRSAERIEARFGIPQGPDQEPRYQRFIEMITRAAQRWAERIEERFGIPQGAGQEQRLQELVSEALSNSNPAANEFDSIGGTSTSPITDDDPYKYRVEIHSNTIVGGLGSHTFIAVFADGEWTTFAGRNPRFPVPGPLRVDMNHEYDNPQESNWIYPVEPPEGMSRREWTEAVLAAGRNAVWNSATGDYALLGGDGVASGNCHSVARAVIRDAGGEVAACLDPPGWEPGLNPPMGAIQSVPASSAGTFLQVNGTNSTEQLTDDSRFVCE